MIDWRQKPVHSPEHKYSYQRGEIATVATLIGLGLLIIGIFASKKLVEQQTQTSSRAANTITPSPTPSRTPTRTPTTPQDTVGPTITNFTVSPDPFIPRFGQPPATIRATLSETAYVTLRVFNSGGQEVCTIQNTIRNAPNFSQTWNGMQRCDLATTPAVPPGRYTFRLWAYDDAGNTGNPNPATTTVMVQALAPTATSIPRPTFTPTPTPTLLPGIVVNSASGQSCNQLCAQSNQSCIDVGLNRQGTDNGMYSYFSDSAHPDQNHCVLRSANAATCATVMNNLGSNAICGGRLAEWTYCKCGQSLPSPTARPTPTLTPTQTATPSPTATPTLVPATPTPTIPPNTGDLSLRVPLSGRDFTQQPRPTILASVQLLDGVNVAYTFIDVAFSNVTTPSNDRLYQGNLVNIPNGTYVIRVKLTGYVSRSTSEVTISGGQDRHEVILGPCINKNYCIVGGDLTDDDLIDMLDFSQIIAWVKRDFCSDCGGREGNINDDANVDIFDFQSELDLLLENKQVHGDNRSDTLTDQVRTQGSIGSDQ